MTLDKAPSRRWRKHAAAGLAFVVAATLLQWPANHPQVYASPGNAVFTTSSPASGSAIRELSRLEGVAEDPDGNEITSVNYIFKRLSDGKYLTLSGEKGMWTDDNSGRIDLLVGDGETWYRDLEPWEQKALHDGSYELEFVVSQPEGTSTQTVPFIIDQTPPEIYRSGISGNMLTVIFSEDLAIGDRSFQPSDFAVKVNGNEAAISHVSGVWGIRNEAIINLAQAVRKTDRVTVAYIGSATDLAGNPVSRVEFEVNNESPGNFMTDPVMEMNLKSNYAPKAGDRIVSFIPTFTGADFLSFTMPSDSFVSQDGAVHNANDYTIINRTDGGTIMVGAHFIGGRTVNLYLFSGLQEGKLYTLAMSRSAGGNELRLLGATSNAAFQLMTRGTSGETDSYTFEGLNIVDNRPPGGMEVSKTLVLGSDPLVLDVGELATDEDGDLLTIIYAGFPDNSVALAEINGDGQLVIIPVGEGEADARVIVSDGIESITVFVHVTVVRPQTSAPALEDIRIFNQASGADFITVDHVPAEAIVKVYDAAENGALLGTATQGETVGRLTVNIDAGISGSEVYVTLTDTAQGYLESERVQVSVPASVTKDELSFAIEFAQHVFNTSTEGKGNGQYPAGSKAELQTAIDQAIAVLDNPLVDQTQVDTARAALDEALFAFRAKEIRVNYGPLTAMVNIARGLHDSAEEGESPGQYPAGSKAILQSAIEAALAVLYNPLAGQDDLDEAVAMLEEVAAAFRAKEIRVNFSRLLAAVVKALAVHDAAEEGGDSGQYPVGAKAELQAAIDKAAAVLDNPLASQAEVDEAESTLEEAVAAFVAKEIRVDFSRLDAVVTEALAVFYAAEEGESSGQYPAGAKAELRAAIDEAAAVLDNPLASQAVVDEAVRTLEEAVATFRAKEIRVDFSRLLAAVIEAQAVHDAAEEGESSGQYPAGSKAELQAAIDEAAMMLDNPGASQAEVDEAESTLEEAVAAFRAKKNTGSGGKDPENPGDTEPPGNPGNPGDLKSGSQTKAATPYRVSVTSGDMVLGAWAVRRTEGKDGWIMDTLELTSSMVAKVLAKVKAAGQDKLELTFPTDAKESSELIVKVKEDAVQALKENETVSLIIQAPDVRIFSPSASFQETDNVMIRIAPIKGSAERASMMQRVEASLTVRSKAGDGEVTLLGQPVAIETNLQNSTFTLPMGNSSAGENAKDTGVYIEHNDGSSELVRGDIVASGGKGHTAIEFDVTQFGTFSIVQVSGWSEQEEEGNILQNRTYISGYANGMFKPNAGIKRAEMAVILFRILGGENSVLGKNERTSSRFMDVPGEQWAEKAIQWAANRGLMNGYPDGTFRPDQSITRAEMAEVLAALIEHTGSGRTSTSTTETRSASVTASQFYFADTRGHWAEDAIDRIKAAGFLRGYKDGTFRPNQALSRAEAVVILNRMLGLQANEGSAPLYKDVSDTHWAFGAIQAASEK